MERTIGAGGSPMTRPLLRAVMVLGVIVTLVSGTGLFAVFSDRATTGSNDVSSGPLGHAADLKLAAAEIGDANLDGINDVVCGTFEDDLATGFYSLTDLQPANDEYAQALCLRNDGSAGVTLTISAIDMTDSDTGCTGDEAAYGDTTCGELGGASQQGELSPLITVGVIVLNCTTNGYLGESTGNLASLAATPIAIEVGLAGEVQLMPGATACYSLRLRYPASTPATDVQLAQSDTVTWRFAFDATVPSA